MSSTTKPAKDNKPFHNTPKLVPRQTAASAARAARIATSKINTIPTKQSSSKNLANPIPNSTARSNNNLRIRFSSKPDLKHEVKQVKQMEDLVAADLVETVNHTSETGEDRYLIPDNIQEDGQGQITYINTPGILEEINENKELVLGSLQDNHTGRNTNVFESPVVQDRNLIEGFTQNRPQSAKSLGSRPNTPQNSSASTPHTPHGLSRPNTPTTPRVVVTPTAISRPNTPRRLAPKLTTPGTCKSQAKEDQMKPSKEDDLKTVYISKKKKFNSMKKDLDLKQREILEIFDNLRELQEQLNRDGISNCGDRHMNDLVVFNVADWTSEEIAQLCRDANHGIAVEDATDMISTALTIDENALADLLANAVNVPTCFADLCLQAFTARQELIDWVKELIDKSAIVVDDGSGECLERIANYNKHGLTMCDDLRIFKDKADEVMCTLCQLARRACRERSALFAVGETLVREIAQLRLNINDLHRQVELQGQQFKQSHISEQKDANTDLERQFEEEKAANAALKDKLANTESQLRQARGRINKMDKQLKEAETSIANLTGTVKVLEDQSRQREVQLEARARKLKESLKSGEFTTGQLTQERDLLNEEIVQLKERIENMQAEKKTLITEHNNKIKEMKASMEEGNRTMQLEMEKKTAAEKALEESKTMIDELKLKVVRLENSLPNPDLPTEREMDIWAQLQATKDSLRSTEDEITALRREKIRFIETLTKITEMENKVGMQQKLAAELLSKEEIFGKMQMQIRELTKNVKLNEEKVSQYEQYVKHLHEHTRAVLDCQGSAIGVSNQDLQHEVMNLKMNLLDAEHRNEELTELLNQKEQQLEQQDKTSRAQARVIKVREELINMLKNKETEQSRELSALQQDLELRMKVVDDVNKQIASKADEIQELFATLENKQQQIHRLEKIVLALEEQQRRAQAQRTRHEEKIAALEHELAAGNRRERRFLFF